MFPADFMFQLTKEEWKNRMSSQIVMTYATKRPKTAIPYAFTEQGLAMLSGVLKSDKAIEVNIMIMRTFVYIRQHALSHRDLTLKLKALEEKYNKKFEDITQAIKYLLQKEKQPTKQKQRKPIGFKIK